MRRLLAILNNSAETLREVRFMEDKINDYIIRHSSFSTEEFFSTLKNENPDIGRSTVYKYLNKLSEQNRISRVGRGLYASSEKKHYTYPLSETAKGVSTLIKENYPLVNFQVWELYQMNEFVNHQIARNTIIVDVENMLDDTIFNLLFDKYPHVLYSPSSDEYYRYAADETIVVKKLISEAPASMDEYHLASLEKILVDLFGKGISGSLIPRSEYRAIFEDCFKRYSINTAMLFRYARRRSNAEQIRRFINENTNITLGDKR